MKNTMLQPAKLPGSVQEFLFACAFWVCAADEQLTHEEQDWLLGQFGEGAVNLLLGEFLELSGDVFLSRFDELVEQLTPEQQQFVFPALIPWLSDCLMADKVFSNAENEVLHKIKKRLGLDNPPAEDAVPEPSPIEAVQETDAEEPHNDRIAARMEPPPETEPTGLDVRLLSGHKGEVTELGISADGRMLVSGGQDKSIRVWDLTTDSECCCVEHHANPITSLCLIDDDVISADRLGLMCRWQMKDGVMIWSHQLKNIGGVAAVAISPDGSYLAVCSLGRRILILDAGTGKILHTWFDKKWSAFRAIAYSPDGLLLAVGGDDKILRFIDPQTGMPVSNCTGHTAAIMTLVFTPDGRQLITAGRDNMVRVWDVAEKAEEHRLYGHSFTVEAVAVGWDPLMILSASSDHTARLWDMQSGECIINFDGINDRFNCAVLLPDNQHAVLAGSDSKIYIVPIAND